MNPRKCCPMNLYWGPITRGPYLLSSFFIGIIIKLGRILAIQGGQWRGSSYSICDFGSIKFNLCSSSTRTGGGRRHQVAEEGVAVLSFGNECGRPLIFMCLILILMAIFHLRPLTTRTAANNAREEKPIHLSRPASQFQAPPAPIIILIRFYLPSIRIIFSIFMTPACNSILIWAHLYGLGHTHAPCQPTLPLFWGGHNNNQSIIISILGPNEKPHGRWHVPGLFSIEI